MSVHYLIDYENVHEAGLIGIKSLTPEDCVYIFHTSPTDRISLSCFDDVQAWVRVIIVPPGKQSLDMHLGSFLGFLIGKEDDPETRYAIVSHDSDYWGISQFWNVTFNMGDKVQCIDRIRFAASNTETNVKYEILINQSSEKAAIQDSIFRIFSKYGFVGTNGLPCMLFSELCTKLNALAEYNSARKKTNKKPLQFLTEEYGDILWVQKQWQQDWVYLLAGRTSSVHPNHKPEELSEVVAEETSTKEDEPDIMEMGDLNIDNDLFAPEESEEETGMADEAKLSPAKALEEDNTEETVADSNEFITVVTECIQRVDESGKNTHGDIRASILRDELMTLPEFRNALKESGMKPIPFIQQMLEGSIAIYRENGIFWAATGNQPESEEPQTTESQSDAKSKVLAERKANFYEAAFNNIQKQLVNAGLDKSVADEIADIFMHSNTAVEPRKVIHTLLCQRFGPKIGSRYYREAIKYVCA